MARRYGDDEIARVLSKLGRRTGKGNRWTQARVATVRRKHGIAAPVAYEYDVGIFNLAQATKITGVSDTTFMRLIRPSCSPPRRLRPMRRLRSKVAISTVSPSRASSNTWE